jgi:hypothetical protein
MKYHFIQTSTNKKTGPIPQTYTEREILPTILPTIPLVMLRGRLPHPLKLGQSTSARHRPGRAFNRYQPPAEGPIVAPQRSGRSARRRGDNRPLRTGPDRESQPRPQGLHLHTQAQPGRYPMGQARDRLGFYREPIRGRCRARRPTRRPWPPSGRYRTDGHPKAQHHTRRPPGPNLPSTNDRLHDVRTLRTMPAGRQTPDYRVSRPWHQGQASRPTRPPSNPNRRSMTAPAPALRRGLSRELSRLQEQNKC